MLGLIIWCIIRTLIKTQDYLDVFARFKQKENIEAVEQMLAAHLELELFERSQLGMHYRCLTRRMDYFED